MLGLLDSIHIGKTSQKYEKKSEHVLAVKLSVAHRKSTVHTASTDNSISR